MLSYQGISSDFTEIAPSLYYVESSGEIDKAFEENEKKAEVRCFNYLEKKKVFGFIPETIDNQFCIQKVYNEDIFVLAFLLPERRADSAEFAFKDLRSYLLNLFSKGKVRFGEIERVVILKNTH